MYIVRKKLSPDEITPPRTRYNSDCDCIQVTSDGGTTWTDAPGLDPRHEDAYRVPALTTSDPRCDAAANMIALLTSMIDADIAAANIIAAATGFIGLVTLFFPIVLLADLVLAVAGIIAGIGSVALSGAFTSDVYDQLLCTFFDHLESDGSITATGLSDLLSDIGANYDGVVFDAISAHSSTLGEVGWSNAGASGSETGDCGACDVWCYRFDFSLGEQGWGVEPNPPNGFSTWTGAQGAFTGSEYVQANLHESNPFGVADYTHNVVRRDDLAGVRITAVTVEASAAEGSDATGGSQIFFVIATDNHTFLVNGTGTVNALVFPLVWDTTDTSGTTAVAVAFGVGYGGSPAGGTATITAITLHGVGINPFGADNC